MNINKFRFAESENKTTAERKREIRALQRKRRSENENRDVKEELMIRAFFESGLAGKESFFVYLSYSSEARTDKLIERLLGLGKRVYCPRIEGENMRAVPFSENMTLSEFGIREPTGEPYEGKIDVAIVPLLAVDERGTRVGYGGGYYDRFLQTGVCGVAVGWCYDFQIFENALPKEDCDEPLDGVISDKRTFFIK